MSAEGPLLERERELTYLRARCGDAASGVGGVVAIRGPAGIGKTALVEAAICEANAAGMVVLRATGSEFEGDLAFGLVRQLFEPALRGLDETQRREVMAGAAGLAARVVLEPGPAPSQPEAVHAALHGLYWLSVELSAGSPLLVCVDDAHWADRSSLGWLAYLARRLDGVGILLVISARDGEPGSDVQLLNRVLAQAGVEVLRPAPFSQAAVRGWLAAAFGQPPNPGFVRHCHRATGGNPLLVVELTAQLRAEGIEPDAAAGPRVAGVAPTAIGRSVLARLARFGPDAVAVAEAAAVLSQDARLDRVAALAGIAIDQAAQLADQLIAAGILAANARIAFAHPVLRASTARRRSG